MGGGTPPCKACMMDDHWRHAYRPYHHHNEIRLTGDIIEAVVVVVDTRTERDTIAVRYETACEY